MLVQDENVLLIIQVEIAPNVSKSIEVKKVCVCCVGVVCVLYVRECARARVSVCVCVCVCSSSSMYVSTYVRPYVRVHIYVHEPLKA